MQNLITPDFETAKNASLDPHTKDELSQEELIERVEHLRRVHVFADLPEEQLRWFAEQTRELYLEPGDLLFRKGDTPQWMAIYLEGEVHARREENKLDGFIYIARAGDPATEVTGMLPYSRMTEFAASGRAVTQTRVLLLHVALFPEMLHRMPVLAERLVWLMNDRVREVTKADQQRDKLMALGKLSAGLAHELNNPAAAARRAAKDLNDALIALREANESFCRHELTPEQYAQVTRFEKTLLERAADNMPLDSMTFSDREYEITTWLEERDINECWAVAPMLVEAGATTAELTEIESQLGRETLNDVLTQVTAQLSTAKLTSEIETSTGRISELVRAIKEYTYMDQASVQQVDVHKGLESTLIILGHKLKKSSVKVARDYAPDMPVITAWGSELNQVWTNLIDNAIDAMGAVGGELRIHTKRKNEREVCVEISDTGAGIPPEVQSRIFEPFFTTKGVGEGTGLGLDTAYRIVRKHGGSLTFTSQPGATRFTVQLPVHQKM